MNGGPQWVPVDLNSGRKTVLSLLVLLESAGLGNELDLRMRSTGLPTGIFIYI